MSNVRRAIAVPLIAAGIALVGACSGSTIAGTKIHPKDPYITRTSTTTKSAPTTAPAAAPGATAPATTSATGSSGAGSGAGSGNGSTPTTATPSKGSSGSVHLTGSFCDKVSQIISDNAHLFTGSGSTDPATQLADLKKGFADLDDAYHQLLTDAPSEIKADLEYAAKATDEANVKIQQLTTYSNDALSKIFAPLSSPEAKKHSDNLDAYTKKTCGFDPSAGASGTGG